MSEHSKIEWTDATWNPVRGCQKISPGCKNCYAEAFAARFRGVPGHAYEQGFDLRLVPAKLIEPLTWNSPKMVFVNSMSDLFQEEVPDEYIMAVAGLMRLANWHTYQVLTKRPGRMRDLLNGKMKDHARASNIWWGVSVEDKRYGIPRIDDLRATNATTRFLSVEPLLEDLDRIDLTRIHWVIVGGESGRRARPMAEEWVQRLLAAARSAGAPFFFKQWGGVNRSRTGRLLNGRTYDELPPVVREPFPPREKRLRMLTALGECVVAWEFAEQMQELLSQARSAANDPRPFRAARQNRQM